MKSKMVLYPLVACLVFGVTAELSANPKQQPASTPAQQKSIPVKRSGSVPNPLPLPANLKVPVNTNTRMPPSPPVTPALAKVPNGSTKPTTVNQVLSARPAGTSSKPANTPTTPAMAQAKPTAAQAATSPAQTLLSKPQNLTLRGDYVPKQGAERLVDRAGVLVGPINQTQATKQPISNGAQELADRYRDPTGKGAQAAGGTFRDQQTAQNNQRWQDAQRGVQEQLGRTGVAGGFANRTNPQGAGSNADARVNQWKEVNRPGAQNQNGPFNPLPGKQGDGALIVGSKTPAELAQEANQRGYNVGDPGQFSGNLGILQPANGGGMMQNPRLAQASQSKEYMECVGRYTDHYARLGATTGGISGAFVPMGPVAGATLGGVVGAGYGQILGRIECEETAPAVNPGKAEGGATPATPATTGGTGTSSTAAGQTPAQGTKQRESGNAPRRDYSGADLAEINRAIQTRYGDGLKMSGEGRKGTALADMDKVIQGTAVLQSRTVNPSLQDRPVGGGPVRGNPLTGDPVDGLNGDSTGGPKGPKPEVNGPLGIPGRGPGGFPGPGGGRP